MRRKHREYSQMATTAVVATFSTLAVGFVIFVCYEMHRMVSLGMNDPLAPVTYIGPSIVGLLAAVLGFYMWRAKAKSQNDLEWEKTRQLTLFREKHPEYFTQGAQVHDDLTGGEI